MNVCVCVRVPLRVANSSVSKSGRLPGPDDRTLIFESRFESGNLRRAVQAYEFECLSSTNARAAFTEVEGKCSHEVRLNSESRLQHQVAHTMVFLSRWQYAQRARVQVQHSQYGQANISLQRGYATASLFLH